MAEVIRMPRLSDTMEEGSVDTWYKKVGEKVSEGDIIAEIQTDKAVQEFESEFDGQILYIGVEEGQTVEIDSILCIIGEEGEDISEYVNNSDKKNTNLGENSSQEKKEETKENKDESKTDDSSSNQEIPEGINLITMPRLSDTMEEGTLVTWHVQEGDSVSEGEIIAEIETDKAVQEFESEFDGTLLKQGLKEGESVPVDSLLAIIGPKGTDVSGITQDSISGSKADTNSKSKEESKISSEDSKENQSEVNNSTKDKEETSHDNVEKSSESGRLFASPLARKMAEEKGYNLEDISGSGDNGRIVMKDVENYQPSEKSTATSIKTKEDKVQKQNKFITGETVNLPNSKMRQTIAKRLTESKSTVPHYYLNIEVDMGAVMDARKQINAIAAPQKISFNDIIVKATAMALRNHRQVNSTWSNETIIQHGDINIGIAVAVEDGLVVPVVNNSDQKSLTDISSEIKDLATRSRDKKIKADEMQGSTFTVSNLGSYGIESFTSIINLPNSCILSVGAILEKPIVKNGAIVPGNIMKLSLACDHRVVDGATGSLFLQTLKNNLETPLAMFL